MTQDERLRLPSLMTLAETADFLRLGIDEVYEAAETGEVPVVRYGRRLFVDTLELLVELGIDPRSLPSPMQSSRRRHDA